MTTGVLESDRSGATVGLTVDQAGERRGAAPTPWFVVEFAAPRARRPSYTEARGAVRTGPRPCLGA